MLLLNRKYRYRMSKDEAVILDNISEDRQGERTAFFHMEAGSPGRTAKIRYDKRGEGFFTVRNKRVYLNDMHVC